MFNKKFSKVVILLTNFLLSLLTAYADTTLTILHTNDTHSNLIPFYDEANGKYCGGVIGRAGLIELIKKEGKDPLIVDAGDFWQGTTFFTLFKGEACYKIAKAMGYAATTMGNHELDLGIEHLLELIDKTGMTVLSCNVVWPEGKRNVFQPYAVFLRNGVKVGVIGRTGFDNWGDCNIKITNKMKLLDDVESVRYYARRIRPLVDVLMVLSHSEVENDRKLAESVAEIDVIIGGHTHAVIEKPELIKHSIGAGSYDNGLGGTLFVEAGEWGRYLGRLDLTLDDNKRIKKWDGKLIPILPEHETYAPKAVRNLVEYYDSQRVKNVSRVIGRTSKPLPYEKDLRKEKMLPPCILAAEGLRYATRADIGMVNSRGVRAGLVKGDINVGAIHSMLPYENTIAVVTLKGTQLQKMLDYAAASWENIDAPNIVGITAELDLKNGKAENIKVNHEPLDSNREYEIAVTSFVADGNCGGDVFFADPVSMKDSGILMRDAVIAYIEYLKEIPNMDIQTLKLVGNK